MVNPVKGEVPLVLGDGQEFVLVMDWEALIEAESAYGKPMQQLMSDATNGFVGASRSLLYGAMRAKHPRATQQDATRILFQEGEIVREALTEAINLAFPSTEGKGMAAGQAGKISGANGAKPVSSRKRSGAQLPAHSA